MPANRSNILISNARIVLLSDDAVQEKIGDPEIVTSADVLIEGDTIKRISTEGLPKQSADIVIDARGNFLLPGIIDTHTHLGDPGFPQREDFVSGTEAAVAGGVTTLFEMPSSIPPASSSAGFSTRLARIEGRAFANVALYGGAGYDNIPEIKLISELGAIGFKSYLMRPPLGREKEHVGMHAFTEDQIEATFREVGKTGKPLVIHAEDDEVVSRLSSQLMAQQKNDMISILSSRPKEAELKAVERGVRIARNEGTRLSVAHVSSKPVLDFLREQKNQRVSDLYVEGRPDYLLFVEDDAIKLGPKLKTFPPVRGKEDRAAIIKAINDSTIDYFGSDHAPRTKIEKESQDLWRIPAGTPSIEIMLRTLLDLVSKKLIFLTSIVRMQRRAAEIFGLGPLRGRLAVGSKADLVLVDLKTREKIRSDNFHTRSKESATIYDGLELVGKPIMTMVGGKLVMQDNQIFKEALGSGQFIQGEAKS
jgi:allantoinase